jgi:hypothetical protein
MCKHYTGTASRRADRWRFRSAFCLALLPLAVPALAGESATPPNQKPTAVARFPIRSRRHP